MRCDNYLRADIVTGHGGQMRKPGGPEVFIEGGIEPARIAHD
jgi:hypothetical protein